MLRSPMPTARPPPTDRLRGLLLGTAVGDAIGLPYEGIGPRRVARLAPAALGQPQDRLG